MSSDGATIASAEASPWINIAAAAAYLNVSRRAVYDFVSRGELRAVKLFAKREIRTRREWCDALMLAHATAEPVTQIARRRVG
jgi:excisionase family DNA binding protein